MDFRRKLTLLVIKSLKKYFATEMDVLFILSAGRSGSTLLQIKLEQTGAVSIVPESGDSFQRALVFYFKNFLFLKWDDLVKGVYECYGKGKEWNAFGLEMSNLIFKAKNLEKGQRTFAHLIITLYQEYRTVNNAKAILVGDKNPFLSFFTPYLIELFPKARFIHIIRDGRAVAYSWKNSLNKYPDIFLAAKRWLYVITLVENYKHRMRDRFLELRYESFVENESQAITRICQFLNISYSDAFNVEQIQLMKKDLHKEHHMNVFNATNDNSLSKWKSLDRIELERLENLLRSQLIKLKYIR